MVFEVVVSFRVYLVFDLIWIAVFFVYVLLAVLILGDLQFLRLVVVYWFLSLNLLGLDGLDLGFYCVCYLFVCLGRWFRLFVFCWILC